MPDADTRRNQRLSDTQLSQDTIIDLVVQDTPIMTAIPDKNALVELKNGKATLKQKSASFEKQSETLQEIVNFREFLEERITRQEPPLSDIPDEHRPLVAKMAHESDKSLAALAKHIRQALLPTSADEAGEGSSAASDALPLGVVEGAIKAIMIRNNYGLEALNGGRTPAAVCLWRWEVRKEYWDWLPKGGREKASQRLVEREQARKDLQAIFSALSLTEQQSIMDPKSAAKQSGKATNKDSITQSPSSKAQPNCTEEDEKSKENDIGTELVKVKANRQKKAADSEKVAKEKERLEKKFAKAEKEKKQTNAQDKSRTFMASFFAKKAAPVKPVVPVETCSMAGPSTARSDFSKVFRPFLLKKDAKLAPTNWFLDSKRKGKAAVRTQANVITLDDDGDAIIAEDISMAEIEAPIDVGRMSSKDRLNSILSSLPAPVDPSLRPPSKINSQYKTYHPTSVRETMTQLTEAEISGDDAVVRSLVDKLRNRDLFPSKVLIFHEDARPGYFGTWTRNSRIIGSRTPFAKDLLEFDYNYDSGEEWEDEGPGDADDVLDDEEEDAEGDDTDSDLDDWLVDDDGEVEVNLEEPEIPLLDEMEVIPCPPKRKVDNEEKESGKRRKVVVPLVPFAKGPCWEAKIGECDYDAFKGYQIRLLNDTPFPIDPFSFVSTCADAPKPSQKTRAAELAGGASSSVVTVQATPTSSTAPQKPTLVPKGTFPDTYLPFLLSKITSLQAGSITYLVEAIYQELRVHKVKKNAIEAKVREVGEKCKERKVWVIKQSLQVCG
ncbi:hypothetical protein AMATHDRAFT_74199 [Amanita thiersii Skay4041]|uniref:Chromatin assembly factor 1 subunit A dimerization domain-containing protein n=1 Tax=Amanita thiersii Skay4041 TaxID=703135 RepID=A0A2A9NN52_9AGAR|nr:hypothetical protein AMATHDRAFT_74199 [Amanita thiersii Skay4041]